MRIYPFKYIEFLYNYKKKDKLLCKKTKFLLGSLRWNTTNFWCCCLIHCSTFLLTVAFMFFDFNSFKKWFGCCQAFCIIKQLESRWVKC